MFGSIVAKIELVNSLMNKFATRNSCIKSTSPLPVPLGTDAGSAPAIEDTISLGGAPQTLLGQE